jgi:predicted HAD superfamily phosphohydrolase YqeG
VGEEIIVPCEVDREGLSAEKVRHFLDVVMRGKTADADACLEKFTHFDVDKLRALTGKAIENVLLDIDDCIAYPYGPILEENLGHIDNMKRAGVNFGVYSNCKGMARLDPLRKMNIPIYSGRHSKPSASGFIDACGTMDFNPNTTWMVDDNPITGGGAVGVLEGVAFVKPVGVDLQYVSLKRRPKLFLDNFFRRLAMAGTLQNNTKIHIM